MQHVDQIYGYTTILLSAAPYSSQLAAADIRWMFYFPLFALPALTLMMAVGHLSKSAVVQTFRKLAPIGSGIGWAFTWLVAERLYTESLRASQLFLYILFSIRPSLNWALSCAHSYNTEYCHDFDDPNVTVTAKKQHYPDNFWPAQEFNRYVLRNNEPITKIAKHAWEANMWYLGYFDDVFQWAFPSIPLVAAHVFTWTIIYICLARFYDRLGDILLRLFVMVPVILYMTTIIGLTGFGFHFTTANLKKEFDLFQGDAILPAVANPMDFWADIKGTFRTSILIVDYSTAITGTVLLATSRLRSGVTGLSAWFLVPVMMLVPTMQWIIRSGCEGHVADLQPAYAIYQSTDETIAFDLLPVCFATSSFGPVWSTTFYTAHYLYSSLGPMIIFVSFIYQSLIDDFPTIQNDPKKCIGMIALAFFLPSMFLYMPLGTKIAAFFRYISQTAIIQCAAFILIYFVYGWQRLEHNILMTTETPSRPSIVEYFTRPTSPIFTFLLFTVVPMMLFGKFVAVFDFINLRSDIDVHIRGGTEFLPFPLTIRMVVGYIWMFAPVLIVVIGAALTVFQMVHKHGLPFSSTFKPTDDWMSHTAVNENKPRPHSLAHSIMSRFVFRKISYKSGLFSLFLFETFIAVLLTILFFLNSLPFLEQTTTRVVNQYRSLLLLTFVIFHVFALFRMRRSLSYAQIDGQNLSLYIGLATIETAVLNAYMWTFSMDHSWGTDYPPFIIILFNTAVRGFCILVAIAIRAHSLENTRPSNTREASEIDEAEMGRGANEEDADAGGDDDDDDSPVIFDLARV